MNVLELYKKHKDSGYEVFFLAQDHNTYIINEFGDIYRIFKDKVLNEVCLEDVLVDRHFLALTCVELDKNPFENKDNVVCMLDYLRRDQSKKNIVSRFMLRKRLEAYNHDYSTILFK